MSILDALLAIGLQGAGYAVKRSAQNKADKQRADVLRQIQGLSDDTMRRQVATTEQQMQQYQPAQRIQALDNVERQAVGRLEQDVLAPTDVPVGPVYGGKVSDAYLTSRAQRTADELRYATRLAGLMGRARAPSELSLGEGFVNQDADTQRGMNASNLRGDIGVRNLQLQSIEPNGGKMLAGDLLQGAGLTVGMGDGPRMPMGGAAAMSTPSADPSRVVAGRNPGGAAAAKLKPGTSSYWTNGRR